MVGPLRCLRNTSMECSGSCVFADDLSSLCRVLICLRHPNQWYAVTMFSSLLFALQVVTVPAGQQFDCTPTHLWDGNGPIWCSEGPRIRLSGIAALELDGSCSSGQLCPESDPIASRDALVSLLGDRTGVGRHGHILIAGPTMCCTST